MPKLYVMGFDSGDRLCYVHAGTHKTGTTAIQRFLADNRDRLAAEGLYYPCTGWLSGSLPGHHDVVSELAGGRGAGTLRAVAAEIACAAPRIACLSSENFEYLHVRTDALVALRDAILSIGYRPRIVLYVRSQHEYVESLYAELAKHGMQRSFASVLGDVLGEGVVRYKGIWAFRFDYAKLATRFADVFGPEAVIVRAYRDDGSAASIVQDFLAAIGFQTAASGAEYRYENMRLTTGGVIDQLFRTAAANLDDARIAAAGTALVARHALDASEPFSPLTARARARLGARFAADNARLVAQWPAAAGMADRRRAIRLESDGAQRARRLFEHAEVVRSAYIAGAQRAHGDASAG